MLDINAVALEQESIEVERQINRLQLNDTEDFEATKHKILAATDSNVSEVA